MPGNKTILSMGTVHTFVKEAVFCTVLFYRFFKREVVVIPFLLFFFKVVLLLLTMFLGPGFYEGPPPVS